MTYGPEERVWSGETCSRCGKDVRKNASSIDGYYFCSDDCLAEYLIEKYEDQIEWIDFITEEALRDRAIADKGDWD